ncbi:RusA family crossover junction endodeoxyribonuclease [Acidaminococcus fermentans]|uniref:RusA family crossover junction endodeoxyribonuclease n=1 Tax=Acidaminococcus fermentans TaxID=905 RepID=UPI0018A6CAF6|nr:RusA family crossover junction endodeoxyribonuclease [Acidaminococcus fermentans]
MYVFIIKGRPITKKNSSRWAGRGKLLPSASYKAYAQAALWQLKQQMRAQGLDPSGREPIPYAMAVTCHYWMPNRQSWPDLVGLLQATSDILQEAGIIQDDGLIVDYGNSHIEGISKENPKVDITIRTIPPGDPVYKINPKLKGVKE